MKDNGVSYAPKEKHDADYVSVCSSDALIKNKSPEQAKVIQNADRCFNLNIAPNLPVNREIASIFLSAAKGGGKEVTDYLEKTFTVGGDIVFGTAGTNAVRVESLDQRIAYLTPMLKHFTFWMDIPKEFVPNVFDEFVQETRHGSDDSRFDEINVSEGDVSSEDLDTRLIRKYVHFRTISTRANVTIHAALTNTLRPGAQSLQKNAAIITVIRENAHQLINGNSVLKGNQYDGLITQHFDTSFSNDTFSKGIFTDADDFLTSAQYLDMRGDALTKPEFDRRTAALGTYFGASDMLLMHPAAIAETNTVQNATTQRWIIPNREGVYGSGFNRLLSPANSTEGTTVMPDQWVLPKNYIRQNGDGSATSSSAPNAPLTSGSNLGVASAAGVAADTFTSRLITSDPGLGSRMYGVTAFNAFGESALSINDTAVTVAATHRVTITSIKVAGSSADPTGYRIFSTDPVTDPSPDDATSKFYEIGVISAAQLDSTVTGTARNPLSPAQYQFRDFGLRLPNTSDAWIIDKSALVYSYLVPPSVMKLAITSLAMPFTAFMVGALKLYAPTKVVRIANVTNGSTPYNTNQF